MSLLGELIHNETAHLSIDYSLLNEQYWRKPRNMDNDSREYFEKDMGKPTQLGTRCAVLVPEIISKVILSQGKYSKNISPMHKEWLDFFRGLMDICGKETSNGRMDDLSMSRRFETVY